MSVHPESEPQTPDPAPEPPAGDPTTVDLPLSANLTAGTGLATDTPAEQ